MSACWALGVLGYSTLSNAQAQPVCVPGTTLCASADGRGGVRIDANGNAQVSPSGASASGQGDAKGNANANANANANGNGNGNASGGGNADGNGNGNANASGNGGGNGNGNGNASGGGNGDGGGGGGGGGGGFHYNGRFGVGVALCPIARVGIWSGFKVGGCAAVSFRWEALTFEMETQLLYGGTTHAFDWTFPLSFLIPLANQKSLYEGPYLRFGGSPVGATFAHAKDGGSFVRFGLFAGGGYELNISRALTWRVFDARLSFDMGTRRAMDRQGHWVDLGLQLGTGIVF